MDHVAFLYFVINFFEQPLDINVKNIHDIISYYMH